MTSERTPEARITEHVYAEIDAANERLEAIGSTVRIVRRVDIYHVDPAPPAPLEAKTFAPVAGDSVACVSCGELVPAAGCQPCPNCGTTNGGCG